MHSLPLKALLLVILACSGCATKIPRDWGSPVPLDNPSALNGSYEDRCVEISGRNSEEVSLVQTMGFVEDFKSDIAYSVDVKADEYGLQMVFHRPFEKTAAIQARYSVKKGWVRLSDYDVDIEGGCSGSGIAPCGFLPFGKIQRLNLTKTDRGDLIITRTERPMMLLLIPLPEEDWALLCKAVPDFDPTSLLPAIAKTPKAIVPATKPKVSKATANGKNAQPDTKSVAEPKVDSAAERVDQSAKEATSQPIEPAEKAASKPNVPAKEGSVGNTAADGDKP